MGEEKGIQAQETGIGMRTGETGNRKNRNWEEGLYTQFNLHMIQSKYSPTRVQFTLPLLSGLHQFCNQYNRKGS